jgi:HK97 family phage major capsid protein
MNITELIEKRANLFDSAKAFLEAHADSDGMLSAEDKSTYDGMIVKVNNLTEAIDRQQALESINATLGRPTSAPLTGRPARPTDERTGRASNEYREGALLALRSNFRQISNYLSEGVAADGGYLVPDEWDSRLIDILNQENIMRSLATVITTSGEHKINVAGNKPAAAWIDEGEALTFGSAKFGQKALSAHKLAVAIQVTEELLYDNAFDLEGYITRQFGLALANKEEEAFLIGDGGDNPSVAPVKGVFTDGTEFNSGNAAPLTSDNLINLVYALERPYRKNASFIMNDKTIAAVRKLKDGNGAYIWQPSYQAGEPDRILGYKVYTSAFAPEKQVAFGDFSYYNIGDRGVRTFKKLEELFAGNGLIGFVMKERVDGILVLPEAIQVMTTP